MPILFAVILACFATCGTSRPAARPGNKIYLVECGRGWCSFRNAKTSAAVTAKTGALRVAQANFSENRVTDIFLNEEAESGDWAIYDHYRFGPDGQPVNLVREIRFAEGSRRVRETFSIHRATVKMLSEVRIDSDGRPISGAIPDWLPAAHVASNLSSFGFASLILNSKSRLMDRLCQSPAGSGEGCNND